MSRSLKVGPKHIDRVKQALKRCGFPSVQAFATEMGIAYATASKFFNGKPVDYTNFVEFSEKLGLDWQEITNDEQSTAATPIVDEGQGRSISVAKKLPENVSNQGIDPSRFIGRERELTELHELLQQNGQVAITAVAGMPGVGKTELAIQYARQHLADYPGGACRLAGQEPLMGLELIRFFEDEFNLIAPDDRDLPSRVQFCWKRWQRDGEVLVLLDDVKRYREIEDYLPPQNSRFKVLMTTQLDFSLNSSVRQLSVKVPELKAAIEILESFIGKSRISQESEIAAELCQWLGCLPLALTLVGSYLQEFPKLSLQTMLARLKSQKLQHASFDPQRNPTLDKKASRALAAAFELSWERLGEIDENAQRIGCYLSLYALAPIPLSIEADEEDLSPNLSPARREALNFHVPPSPARREALNFHVPPSPARREALNFHVPPSPARREALNFHVPPSLAGREALNFHVPPSLAGKGVRGLGQEEVEVWETAIKNLRKLHLLDEKGADSYQFHALIREFLREKLAQLENAEDLKRGFAAQMVAVAKQIQQQPTRDNIVNLSPWIPHLEELANLDNDLIQYLSDEDKTRPFTGLGWFYEGQSFYQQAERWKKLCLEVAENHFGAEHPDFATSLNNLAGLYFYQGRYGEAEPLYLQALEIDRLSLPENHPGIAIRLNNLALLYYSQGRYGEAEPLYLQALEIDRLSLPENHPGIATDLNNLAQLYKSQGRYGEAEPLYLQALEILKLNLPENHPNIASNLNNLAQLYYSQGLYGSAEPLYLQALEIGRLSLPENHPSIAIRLNNLAQLYESQGRYGEAEPLYLQALEIFQQTLGRNHPNTVTVRQNFALFLKQAITEERADLEALLDNPLVREILAEVLAEIEPSQDTTNE